MPFKKTRFFGHSLCKWGHFERVKTILKMLPASWFFVCIFKRFRCLNAKNLESVGQRAAKLLAIKLWEWFDPGCSRTRVDRFESGRGWKADFFFRPPTLIVSSLEAIWSTDSKFSAFKDLNLLKKHTKNQETSSILSVVFALSKWPHLHRKTGKSITLTEHNCILSISSHRSN